MTIKLTVPGKLPSWNAILGMGHWQRAKLKKEIQSAFLSALRACGGDSSTRTTSQKSTMSIAADTLALYMQTRLTKRKLKSASARRRKTKRNTR
jgi:hypothetical protein